jgi:molybdopterin converting factor small subunit
LIVGLGVPSELTDALTREGCDILRLDTPLQAAIALLRGDAEVVLSVGDMDEQWMEFSEVALASGKLVAVDSLVTLPVSMSAQANGNGNGNGHGYSNGNGQSNGHGASESSKSGLSISEVVDLVQRRMQEPSAALDHIYTKVGNKLRKVPLEDILYIEVEGKYSALQVKERKYNVKASLKDLLQKLPSNRFVRVSRNFVVNLSRIQHIDTFQYTVKVGDMEIPISRTYKEELMRHINLI